MATAAYTIGKAAFSLGAWGASLWAQKYVQTEMPHQIMHETIRAAANRGASMFSNPYLSKVGEIIGTGVGYIGGPFAAQSPYGQAAVNFTATVASFGVTLGAQFAANKFFGQQTQNSTLPVFQNQTSGSNSEQIVSAILQQAQQNRVDENLLQQLASNPKGVNLDELSRQIEDIRNKKDKALKKDWVNIPIPEKLEDNWEKV